MVWSWNKCNFTCTFALDKIFLMIVWIVSSDLNFSPNRGGDEASNGEAVRRWQGCSEVGRRGDNEVLAAKGAPSVRRRRPWTTLMRVRNNFVPYQSCIDNLNPHSSLIKLKPHRSNECSPKLTRNSTWGLLRRSLCIITTTNKSHITLRSGHLQVHFEVANITKHKHDKQTIQD
jgi:hypothetical protein